MIFTVEVKTMDENLERGDLVYNARKLSRVEHVGKPHGKGSRFRVIGKVNLDRQLRTDRSL